MESTGKLNLGRCCHISSNRDNDKFVGIKVDTKEGAQIYFPQGYDLPLDDGQIRKDIRNLINVLLAFNKEEKTIQSNRIESVEIVDYPFFSYLSVIRYYLSFGYYIEKEKYYASNIHGKTNWRKTIKNQSPFVSHSGNFIYATKTVSCYSNNSNALIAKINKYCVYESLNKFGWLFLSAKPEKASLPCSAKQAEYILTKSLLNTNIDSKKMLFKAMIDIIRFSDNHADGKEFLFGTYGFENIWEYLINHAFGIDNKEDYLPRTRWLLDYGHIKEKKPLMPDTIMIYKNNCFVLDAKYYHYGITANPDHLPNGTDINKQITYGEYVKNNFKESFDSNHIYNAFIMPFNRKCNFFNVTENIINVGEAIGDWKENLFCYERIQGILIDTRYLMFHYLDVSGTDFDLLAESIEKVKDRIPKN